LLGEGRRLEARIRIRWALGSRLTERSYPRDFRDLGGRRFGGARGAGGGAFSRGRKLAIKHLLADAAQVARLERQPVMVVLVVVPAEEGLTNRRQISVRASRGCRDAAKLTVG
jgi:hypothetical protein